MPNNIYFADRKTDRKDFEDQTRRLAAILKNHGIGEDDVVAALLRNDIAHLCIIEACRLVGAYYVNLNWHNPVTELTPILEDSRAKIVIGHSDLTRSLTPANGVNIPVLSIPTPLAITKAYHIDPALTDNQTDLSLLMKKATPVQTEPLRFRAAMHYTSGSTGRPKGIRRIYDPDEPGPYVKYKALAATVMQLNTGDRFYTSAPLYHSAPNTLSMICLASDYAELHISPKFDAEDFLRYVEQYKITHIYIVPTMMVRLLKLPKAVRDKYDVSSLKFSLTTGSAWPVDIKQAMIDWFGPIFYESYGASEIGFMTLMSSADSMRKPGSVGKVLAGGSIKILDENKQELPAGESGLIYAYLPMFGSFTYSNADGALEKQRYGEHTTVGDIGYLDADDYLYINDRKKDMIISGGANIFPSEIEAALIDMPQVYDCAVFGAPDPEFGERIIAAVQCVDGQTLTTEEVRTYLIGKIAKFKIPRHVDFHDQLPREDSGKIFKQRLRAPYWADTNRKI